MFYLMLQYHNNKSFNNKFDIKKERVREENLRSIKILNSYLDATSQNKGVSEEHLKFYIAEKENNKNKKYIYFDGKFDFNKGLSLKFY